MRSSRAISGRKSETSYRSVLESATKLDNVFAKAVTINDLFSSQSSQLRHRFREQTESILLNQSQWQEFGRKAEEFHWRKLYYNVMQFYKKHKKNARNSEVLLLKCYFVSGIGFYNNLLISLSLRYKISIEKLVPFISATYFDISTKNPNCPDPEYIKQMIHRILIYIGDLTRYLCVIDNNSHQKLAIRYYNAALIWDPQIGMPFNQLGTLFENLNYSLDSTFYYMKCLLSKKPFDGAEGNLRRVFESSSKRRTNLGGHSDESSIIIQRAIDDFLQLSESVWFMKFSASLPLIFENIKQSLSSFEKALQLQPKLSTSEKPTFLQPIMITHMTLISILLIKRCECELSGSSVVSGLVDFLLNIMTFLLGNLHQLLLQKLSETSCNGNKENQNEDVKSLSQGPKETPQELLSSRQALSRLRRRKAAINYDVEDSLSLDFDDNDSDLGELEATALSTIEALDIGSDLSDSEESQESDVGESSISDETFVTLLSSEISQNIDDDILNFLYRESSLPAINLICDFLADDINLIIQRAKVLKIFFENFCSVLNILLKICDKSQQRYFNLAHSKRPVNDCECDHRGSLTVNFPIDYFLKREVLDNSSLTQLEMGFLCVGTIVNFGYTLEKRLSCFCFSSQGKFDYSKNMYDTL